MNDLSDINSTESIKIIIGASSQSYIGWIQTQEEDLNLLQRSDWIELFGEQRIDVILAEHVWEHLTYEEGVKAARICYEFLKPNGYIRCAVPDRFFRNEWYQNLVKIGGPGPKDHPAASHKIVHDYKSLTKMFEEAGFKVKLLEFCDEDGRFHFQEWDPECGFIYRSFRFDHRNKHGDLGFVSLIVDAIKE
ncbi:Predicted SAM-depedendent methyltransferase [Paenibacillus sp. UNCCL117]|uniref:class I SAM-dependent methyltransferase n=1 Tax=unclassified Paenibacillus TaxID=185978 RepID=UPI0008862A99|nr:MULTISPECIES: methyltransferase domain-containing protein [unclassified Paenibacillus]SDD72694.1 Predicted SAM-depedendent methyltransferase [Paenibacillus sp. cl123]SFW45767.1 Predicted SAM-depedendent methyltransferase [Paenibacillus sp. UNCCL117]